MKIELWYIGKTAFAYLKEGMQIYEKRLKKYLPFKEELLPDVKNAKSLSEKELKIKEGEILLKKLKPDDCLILLDEKGKTFTSVKFAYFLEKQMQHSYKRIIFQIGGAYGFSEAVYQRANFKVSLSPMTFSHQMVRVFALEQIYRGMTILKGEPYHHQ